MHKSRGRTLLALLAAIAPAPAQGQVGATDIDRELVLVVDAPDPVARRRAADALAQRPGLGIEALRDRMRVFGSFAQEPPGRSHVDVSLFVGKATEKTALHFFVPRSYDPKTPAPLLLIGHWTGGRGEQAIPAWTRFAEQNGCLLLAPSEAGANVGWAFSERERTSALSALRYVRRRFNVDENRILCTGVSRGGHMTWDLALRHPDVFAAIAPMIGGPRIKRVHGQNNFRYAENVVGLPIRDLQGSKDDPYLVSNLRLIFKRLEELKARDARLIEFPELGHSYEMGAVDWDTFFGGSRRDPRPAHVVRMMAVESESRAFYVDVLQKDDKRVAETPQIPASAKFDALDEQGQREYIARAVEHRTARLEVTMSQRGEFVAKGTHVRSFRLLLDPEMFVPDKPVLLRFNGRQRRFKVTPDKQVLCREFAERFDRTFLPIGEIVMR